MENQELMIRVQDVKKQYRLGQIGGGTLRGDLQSWWARKRGKEDPNTLIGTDQRLQRRGQVHAAQAADPRDGPYLRRY